MNRYVRPLAVAMTLAMLIPLPAAAAPSFRMSTSQKIDLVRDLPNDETFERDGQYLDLGYLYTTERINGADVATKGGGFVLYHDDQYAPVGPSELAAISGALGEDPTAGYIPPAAPRASTSFAGDSEPPPAAFTSPTGTSNGTPYKPARHVNVGAFGWIVPLVGFLVILSIRLGLSWMLRSMLRAAFGGFSGRRRERSWSASKGDGLFEARVEAQMAALNAAAVHAAGKPPADEPWQAQPMNQPPAARGFGRKGV